MDFVVLVGFDSIGGEERRLWRTERREGGRRGEERW